MGYTKIEARRTGNMAFEMELDGHRLITDASKEAGGNDLGPSPKKLLLAGLIGCTGIDVASMIKKMKIDLEDLNIEVEADSSEEHPKVYTRIHLTYRFKGKNLPKEKLERAVTLSQEKYCGVSAMLQKAAPVTYDIVIEE
ncbi:OsmC family protein [Muricomes intestini]|jgi:putative redox protein|uniref:OsmC family protein n=1 Tax=Muricomes intestini TaxID=1796634 RepID=UPI002FE2A90C